MAALSYFKSAAQLKHSGHKHCNTVHLQDSMSAASGSETMSEPFWQRLPLPIVVHILSFLPPTSLAWFGRQVCKAAYLELKKFDVKISVRSAELPLSALQHYCHHHLAGDADRGCKLMAARARHYDWAGIELLRSLNPPCDWDRLVCYYAAQAGCLPVLQWARQQDPPCPWSEEVCSTAAFRGHLHILQWLRQQDPPCPWDHQVCNNAAYQGHLHVLQWVRQQDPPCPWDARVVDNAIMKNHLAVVQWAWQQQNSDCEWDREKCLALAGIKGHRAIIQWLEAQPE